MSQSLIFGLCGALVISCGLYGFIARRHLLRKVLSFNLIGAGLFLVLGSLGRRAPGALGDPVPQALIITGVVVALCATALAIALIVSLYQDGALSRLPAPDDDG